MEDQPALAAELPGVNAEFDEDSFDGHPHSGPARSGAVAAEGDTSPEYPPILIFQAALGVFDLLLSAGYLGFWYLDPESLAQSVVGVSGVPLLLGCLAVLTGGWIRHQHKQPGRAVPCAAWTIFGMAAGLLLALLAAGFPIWLTLNSMM